MKRVLLVHLVSNGDCLMATTVARQIKTDFPGCHLTWAISWKCKQVIEENPYVDEIWSVEYPAGELPFEGPWRRTVAEAEARRRRGEFDEIFTTQIFPDHYNDFDGTTRSTIFRAYGRPVTVPVAPVMRLREEEVARVTAFAEKHGLARYKNVVLFECAPASGQSFLNVDIARRVAARVATQIPDTSFVLSSPQPFTSDHPAVIDASSLTYRENAELSKHCTLLLGCSSGITWLLTSDWAKRLPTIQFLRKPEAWYLFASVRYDHAHFGLPAEHVMETDVATEDETVGLVAQYLRQGSFGGLRSADFKPSVDQIYNLYRMMHGRVEVRRVLRNFQVRNPTTPTNVVAFFGGLASHRVRQCLRDLVGRASSPNAK